MKPPQTPTQTRFHAHVYFDEATLEQARRLTDEAGGRFAVDLGRLHEKPVGPHPSWSRQIAFDATVYRELIDWLDANRGGLTILVHADTGDDLADHTDHAWWLGAPATLDVSLFAD
ncbi:MAG: 4,5-dioxygenase [Proteobacteria bacterium]|nr:MAG: 4,5-dioxygenase [Pseudomonadota bacterium]